MVLFNGAKFAGSRVRFSGTSGSVRFSNARFTSGTVRFDAAEFTGATSTSLVWREPRRLV